MTEEIRGANGVLMHVLKQGLYGIKGLFDTEQRELFRSTDIREIFRVYEYLKTNTDDPGIAFGADGCYEFMTWKIPLADAYKYYIHYGEDYPIFFNQTKEEDRDDTEIMPAEI